LIGFFSSKNFFIPYPIQINQKLNHNIEAHDVKRVVNPYIADQIFFGWLHNMYCANCGKEFKKEGDFCPYCGHSTTLKQSFLMVTTPTISGFRIKKVIGVVTGLTPRTRGMLGKFVAGIQAMLGGEVTAFTSELEKARLEAMDRVRKKAMDMGANAVIGLDLETSDIGLQAGVTVISATGTAVVIEPE
jgi:uncharacterized protein YbjQ (UPF0145 family)